jgi:hypothetical protein
MSRTLALIMSFMLLWAGEGCGLSDICCCTTAAYTSMERTGDNCGFYDDHVGGIQRDSDHHTGCQCLGLNCEDSGAALRLSQFESLLPYNQVAPWSTGMLNVELRHQNSLPLYGRIHFYPSNPLDLLLRTCTFRS